MLEPAVEFAAGQGARSQRVEQLRSMLGVDARQRREHPRRRPGRSRDLALGEHLAVNQFAKQERFFQCRKRPRVDSREDLSKARARSHTRDSMHAESRPSRRRARLRR